MTVSSDDLPRFLGGLTKEINSILEDMKRSTRMTSSLAESLITLDQGFHFFVEAASVFFFNPSRRLPSFIRT